MTESFQAVESAIEAIAHGRIVIVIDAEAFT